jgi:predicted nucleotide-binding protein
MRKARILVADNDLEVLVSTSKLLKDEGYEVIQASSFEQARKLLEDPKVDLGVLDLRLSREDDASDLGGFDLAVRAEGKIPIVILSGRLDTPGLILREQEIREKNPDIKIVVVPKGPDAQKLLDRIAQSLVPRVFIVHGHDDAARLEVVDFLKTVRLQPLVLRDQPGSGRTIIEKFEDFSNVSFVVVLLTPDDVGGLYKEKPSKGGLQPRARQNVILELGFFLGLLGRDHVAVLSKQSKEAIEIPSDYTGVQYLFMDSAGNWRFDLAREMEAVHIHVDLNKIVRRIS